MATKPTPGGSSGTWGTELNAYLVIGHETDGTHGTKAGFQERGDPAAPDMAVGNFTTDATWRDINLNTLASVPTSAKAVLLRIQLQDGVANSKIRFRENGNSNDSNIAFVNTFVANIINYVDIIVAPDSSGIIEYKGDNLTFTVINLLVAGWWL